MANDHTEVSERPERSTHNLHTTDELIAAYDSDGLYDRLTLEAVIPAAINALYEARNADYTMHGAGAATAIAVVTALEAIGDSR